MKFEYDSEGKKMDDNSEKREHKRSSDIPVKEIGELLDEVSTKLPKLLEGIQKSYYSVENGTNAGKSLGAFYKELITAGMSDDVALRLTERFMVSIKDLSSIAHKDD
jgi:hypothetical protein